MLFYVIKTCVYRSVVNNYCRVKAGVVNYNYCLFNPIGSFILRVEDSPVLAPFFLCSLLHSGRLGLVPQSAVKSEEKMGPELD